MARRGGSECAPRSGFGSWIQTGTAKSLVTVPAWWVGGSVGSAKLSHTEEGVGHGREHLLPIPRDEALG